MKRPQVAEELEEEEVDKLLFLEVLVFKFSNFTTDFVIFLLWFLTFLWLLFFTGEEVEAGPDSSEDDEASTSSGRIGGGGSGQAAAVTSVSGGTGSGRSRSTQASGSRLSQVTGPWKKENSYPLVLNYSGVPGPTGNVLSTSSFLIDAFYIFITVQVWDLLVTEMNTYGARIIPGDWVDTYVEEMQAFIGMLIVMGVAKLPSLEMYWSSSVVDLAPSLIRNVMSRDCFRQLLRCFHVNAVDPSLVTRTPNYDRLYKVRKLLDLVFPLFESAYTTHKELSIDEAMIPYKGCLRFKQYMKDKPTKWGIKLLSLAMPVMVMCIGSRFIQVRIL